MASTGDSASFYRLRDAHKNGAYCGLVGAENLDELWRVGRSESASTILVRHNFGTRLVDFLWISGVAIVGDRVVQLLHSNNVTGWSLFNVILLDAESNQIAGYNGLAITGRCAWVGFDRRETALVKRIAPSGVETSYFSGLKFPLDSWDGSDIFVGANVAIGGAWTLGTKRVFDLFKKERITNCLLTPVDEVDLLAQPSAIIRTQTAN